jgi:hypothetical protein
MNPTIPLLYCLCCQNFSYLVFLAWHVAKEKGRDGHPGLLFYGERMLFNVIRSLTIGLLEFEFIDPTAVGTTADRAILGEGPFQGMGSAGDGIGPLCPTGAAGNPVLLNAVNVKPQVIIIGFG